MIIGQNYPERIIKNLDEAREASLNDVANVRKQALSYTDPHSGRDIIKISSKKLKINLEREKMIVVPLIYLQLPYQLNYFNTSFCDAIKVPSNEKSN